jgi:cytochrome c biogenesis protein CcmG/thiol:disulfide interchange protein DsbE
MKVASQAIAVTFVLALLALLVWKVAQGSGKTKQPANFTLSRLDRPGELTFASLRGKAVVLNFWASWCIPCKREAPLLEQAWRRYRARGLVVLGMDANDFKVDARRFMRKYGVSYPVVYDGSGETLGPYGVTGFPETVFVGRDGRYVGEHVRGELSRAQLERNINLVLRT